MKITIDETPDRQRIRVQFDDVTVELDTVVASWLGQRIADRARFLGAKSDDDRQREAVEEHDQPEIEGGAQLLSASAD